MLAQLYLGQVTHLDLENAHKACIVKMEFQAYVLKDHFALKKEQFNQVLALLDNFKANLARVNVNFALLAPFVFGKISHNPFNVCLVILANFRVALFQINYALLDPIA